METPIEPLFEENEELKALQTSVEAIKSELKKNHHRPRRFHRTAYRCSVGRRPRAH